MTRVSVGPVTPDLGTARRTLHEAYTGVTEAVSNASDEDLTAATRCDAWVGADLLFHLLLDAQRLPVALATPTEDAPTRNAVSYWRPFGGTQPGRDPWEAMAHVRFVRLSAAAYSSPQVPGIRPRSARPARDLRGGGGAAPRRPTARVTDRRGVGAGPPDP